jgi:hypothetical protein
LHSQADVSVKVKLSNNIDSSLVSNFAMACDKTAIVLFLVIKFAICIHAYSSVTFNTRLIGNYGIVGSRYEIAYPNENFISQNFQSLSNDPGIGLRNRKYRWPRIGNKIVVPFLIDSNAGYSRLHVAKIFAAMRHISDRTCINFKWRNNEEDYLNIYSGKWCTSYVGRIGGAQDLSLSAPASCANKIGSIIHELLHALGFAHMQSHADRDHYITVLNENISSGEEYQFEKINPWEATNFGTPYDYFSIMHYNSHAFSKNGKATIVTRDKRYNGIIGQNNKLSTGDVTRIQNMYNCKCIERGWKIC